jgi:predicted amidohydrolase YtcJ
VRNAARRALVSVLLASVGVGMLLQGRPGAQAPQRAEPATLVLRNGNIVTVEQAAPRARAIAARGDRIVAIGSDADLSPYLGPATRVIDLKGATVIPGFIDSHGHFTGIGQAKLALDLTKVTSWDEIVAMVATAAKKAKPGEVIVGRGWHQEKWSKPPQPNQEGFPIHDSLSGVSPDNPVILTHASGHATIGNAKAMQMAGITSATPNPPGGEILKDKSGRPIGVFRETASNLLRRADAVARAAMTAAQVADEQRRIIELADQECLSKGVTTFHDAGSSFATIDRFKQMAGEGRLGIRLYAMVAESNARLAAGLATNRVIGAEAGHVTLRAIKVVLDGALGSRGAWLLEPYSDSPGSTGLNTVPMDSFRETAKLAIANDFQLCTHAIGDRANREVLNVYEEAFKANPGKTNLRWRDEHTQHLNPADIPRFGKLGVIASMQGIHCTSDALFVLARLGKQRAEEGAYVWQKLMKSGALIPNGTDAPVEDVDPIPNFYATVSRKLKDGSVFYGDQKMTREEALRSYTINGAFAAFEEDVKGSLKVGKYADLTILSKDIMTVPDDEIPTAKVLYTIVGGTVRYAAK